MRASKAAIGFRAKTGRAIAVALTTSPEGPAIVCREEVSLVDPRRPETGQPYHEVMELPWPDAAREVTPFVSAIEEVAARALGSLVHGLAERNIVVDRIGVVGSLDRPLEKIGNPHIRAHAAEGMLFRRVIESAARDHGLKARTFSQASLIECAVGELDVTIRQLQARLKALGAQAGPPWRADEKAAATAAWLVLR